MSDELPEVVQLPRDDLSAAEVGAIATAILEAAVDAIIVINPIGAILAANEATVRLFGWEREQMLGRNVSMLMPEPFRSEHDSYLSRYLATGDAHIIGMGREVEAQRADGSVFPMSLSVSEVKTGEQHLFTGIIHDLTERNRQRDELERINAELEDRVMERTRELDESMVELQRSNRDLDQFASVASHDLKTPLRNVRQALELLEEHLTEGLGVEFDDEAVELRNFTMSAAGRMEELIDGLLAYARVHGATADDAVDLGDVLAGVVAAVHLDLEELGATLDIAELPMVVGNAVQLRQLFYNLIGNAIRYRSPERTLELSVEAKVVGDRAELTVRDNGIGIDPSHHERIFELFRRVQSTSDGVGLGLAICQRVVEEHGGEIRVESAPNEGAAFIFDLPLSDPARS